MLPFLIEPISIYVKDDVVYAGNNMIYRKASELEQYEEYSLLKNISTPYIWLPKENIFDGTYQTIEYISFLRKIGSNNAPVGYMRVYIKTEQLEKILRNMVGYDGEVAFIYSANEIIAATDFERAEQIYIDMTELAGNNQGTGNWYGVRSEDGICNSGEGTAEGNYAFIRALVFDYCNSEYILFVSCC